MTQNTATTDERQQLVHQTIVSAYQAQFEAPNKNQRGDFAANVAKAIIYAGIARLGEALADQIDIMHLHVEAHREWMGMVHPDAPLGYTFRNYLADRLIERGFYLDESKAR